MWIIKIIAHWLYFQILRNSFRLFIGDNMAFETWHFSCFTMLFLIISLLCLIFFVLLFDFIFVLLDFFPFGSLPPSITLHIARTWIRPRRTYWNIRLALVNSSAILWNPHLSRALMNGKNDVSHLCPYRHKGYVTSYLLAICIQLFSKTEVANLWCWFPEATKYSQFFENVIANSFLKY